MRLSFLSTCLPPSSHGRQGCLMVSWFSKCPGIQWCPQTKKTWNNILGYIGDLGVSLGQSYSSVKNCMDPSLHPTSGFHPTWWWLHGGHYFMCENPKDLTKVDDKSVDVDVWKWGIPVWQTVKWKIKKRLTSVLIVVHWWFSQTRIYWLHAPWNDPRAENLQNLALLLSILVFFSLTCHDMSI